MSKSETQFSPRVAVVGCGMWGRNLVRVFAEAGVLDAVVDDDPVAAASMADRFDIPAMVYRDVLADANIDAIVLASPAMAHAPMAIDALLAGKHVFVEKPLALNIKDAQRVVALADEKQRVLMVGHLLQYHSAFQALERLVRDGTLGRLQYLYSHRLNLGRIRREENALWSFAPHDISMILRLVGEEPDHVSAVGANFLHGVVADVTTTHLTFPSGIHGHVFVSWLHPYKDQRLVVIGEGGMAVFDDGQPWEGKVVYYPHRIEWRDGVPNPSRAEAVAVPLDAGEPLAVERDHFLECCRSGATPRTDGREGLSVLRVLERAQTSLAMAGGADDPRKVTDRFAGARVHSTAVVDDDVEIGAGTSIWHFSHVLSGTAIGRDCSIGQNASIGPNVRIGEGCKIQNNVSVFEGVTLEDGVFCGPSCVFTNVLTPRAEVSRRDEFAPTVVRRGASIGANATIVCGNTIGAYAMVAAGAVVTRDVAAFALVAGIPARRIGWVSRAGERLGEDLRCRRTGAIYALTAPEVLEEVQQ